MTAAPPSGTRRGFLTTTAAAFAVGAWGVPLRVRAQTAEERLETYTPQFLDRAEWSFVVAAVARLIPSEGEGPGAIEAMVPVFIDRQLAGGFGRAESWYMTGPHRPDAAPELGWQSPYTPADVYRRAIPVFDAWCRSEHGAEFAALAPEAQDAALTALEDGSIDLPAELRDFFELLLANTKEGYFADPLHGGNDGMRAWIYIGFPGARANFREWVERHNVPYPLGPVSIGGERA